MNLKFDVSAALEYKSNSQKIRVMGELWVADNMFCPCCGNCHLTKLDNNLPVADLRCDNCGELFELKTKKGNLCTRISDGAYSTMLERISSESNPDLLAMTYDDEYCINDLILIPKFFFVPQIIEKRKPLSSSAKRSGWEGCNILYSEIPFQGRIPVIQNSCFCFR